MFLEEDGLAPSIDEHFHASFPRIADILHIMMLDDLMTTIQTLCETSFRFPLSCLGHLCSSLAL